MNQFLLTAVCFLVQGWMVQVQAETKLSMQDLKALEQQKSWQELLNKGDQVPPAERTSEFNPLMTSAGTYLIGQIGHDSGAVKQAAETAQIVIKVEKKYPFVISDPKYLEAKASALGTVADACTRTASTYGCGSLIEVLSQGVQHFPKGAAKKIAVLMGEDGRYPSEILRFWALAAEDDRENCQHGTLQKSVINGLKMDPTSEQAKMAMQTAKICADQLDEALMDGVRHAEKNSSYTRNACPLLKSRGKNNMAMRDKCA